VPGQHTPETAGLCMPMRCKQPKTCRASCIQMVLSHSKQPSQTFNMQAQVLLQDNMALLPTGSASSKATAQAPPTQHMYAYSTGRLCKALPLTALCRPSGLQSLAFKTRQRQGELVFPLQSNPTMSPKQAVTCTTLLVLLELEAPK
jgi:hypothetical protein